MKIILIKDVPKVGKKYDIKEVSPGYGRNFLIARGLALVADNETVKRINEDKKKKEDEREGKIGNVFSQLSKIKEEGIKIKAKASPEGHLFAAIHKKEIIDELKKKGVELEEDWIILDKPIKTIGSHKVGIKVGKEKGEVQIEIVNN